jgi:hypothetical protein
MISDTDELDLLTEEELAEEQRKVMAKLRKESMNSLATAVVAKLRNRISNRNVKQSEWLECSHLYYGSLYSTVDYAETPFAGSNNRKSRPDFNIVRTKCDAAIAQCIDMQFAIGEKNWDLWPAANNSEPSAALKAQAMSQEIEAQLDSCRYAYQSRLAIMDRIVLGTGVLKSPVNTGKVKTVYRQDSFTGTWITATEVVYSPIVERVDPWMFFPDDTVSDPDKIMDAIQIHPMSAYELLEYRNHEGYEKGIIDEVLKEAPSTYHEASFVEYQKLVSANPALFKNKYCVIEYHGPIKKEYLQNAGITPAYETPLEDYFGEVWVVNGKVIRLELENIEGSFETPYAVCPWKHDPSSVFGFGHPLTMKDQQRVVTQTWHMILDNASLSSGPQGAIQKRFIIPADGEWNMAPRKMWHLTDPTMKVQDAIQFFNVPNVMENLVPVLNMAREFSDEESATSALAAGLESTQLGASATGDMMAMKNSTVLLDAASEEWDDRVTSKVIRRMYAWNMQYNDKQDIKGNFSIDVRSANEYKNKQIHVRDIEKLSVETGQNPQLAKWIKPDELTHLRLALMTLPTRNLLRTEAEAEAWEKQQAAQAAQNDPNAMKAQVEMAKLEVAKQKLASEEQRSQIELQIEQMRLSMEARVLEMKEQVSMANNQAMAMAAQASVLKAELDYQAKLAALQLKSAESGVNTQVDAFKYQTDKQLEIAQAKQQAIIDNREMDIYEEEIKLKKEGKTGI